jgi:aminopeptidase N
VKDGYHSNGDPFYSDVSNYVVNITCNKDLTLASTGSVIEENFKENTKITTIKAKAVRDFAIVLSNKFSVVSDIVDDIVVNYYYYNDENYEYNLKTSVDSVKYFNEQFAKYPYPVLNVVKTNFVHGGMEYPNLVYISDEVTEQTDYTNVIVHEIAHQWWYGVVGNNEFVSSWLDEGLTEYSTLLFYENYPEYNVDIIELKKNLTSSYVTFVDLYKSVLGSVDTTMNRRLDEYSTEPEYVYVTYVKGLLFFDNLREVVGDANFFKSLKEYFEQNKFKNATVDNLLFAFESVCKTSLEGLFNSWTQGLVVIQ